MVGLEKSVLMRTKFLQLRFEKLTFLSGNGFLIEYQDIGDVIGVNLIVKC